MMFGQEETRTRLLLGLEILGCILATGFAIASGISFWRVELHYSAICTSGTVLMLVACYVAWRLHLERPWVFGLVISVLSIVGLLGILGESRLFEVQLGAARQQFVLLTISGQQSACKSRTPFAGELLVRAAELCETQVYRTTGRSVLAATKAIYLPPFVSGVTDAYSQLTQGAEPDECMQVAKQVDEACPGITALLSPVSRQHLGLPPLGYRPLPSIKH